MGWKGDGGMYLVSAKRRTVLNLSYVKHAIAMFFYR
jgi:hypothetical protein